MLRILVIALTFAGAVLSGVSAVGLGQLALHSLLSQPLNITIDLHDTQKLKPDQIIPKLGSADDFRRARIARPDFLEKLKFMTVEKEGKLQIRVFSDGPVNEPMINFLLEIQWPKGRVLREYTLLLDPPAFGTREVTYEEQSATERSNTKIPSTSIKSNSDELIYTVKPNDNLWEIASQFATRYHVTAEQMMSAIQKNNPHAFMHDNPNKLKKDVLLNIPVKQEVMNIDSAQESPNKADALIKVQHQQLEQLTSENMELIQKLEQLEAHIDKLDSVIANQTVKEKPGISTTTNKPVPQPEKPTSTPKQPPVLTTVKTDSSHALTSKTQREPVVEDDSHSDKLQVQDEKKIKRDKEITPAPAIKNKSITNTTTAKIQHEDLSNAPQPWYATLFNNFGHFLLLSAGAVLVLFLGWLFERRRKKRKEEEEMDDILAAEALEEEKKAADKTENQPAHDQNLEKEATKFSQLVTPEDQSKEKPNSAEIETGKSEYQQSNTESINEDTTNADSDLLLSEEDFSATEGRNATNEEDGIAETDELTLDLEEDGILNSSPVGVEADQPSVDNKNTKQSAPPEPVTENNDEGLSVQLEQIDAEIKALSQELSTEENPDNNTESTEYSIKDDDEDIGIGTETDIVNNESGNTAEKSTSHSEKNIENKVTPEKTDTVNEETDDGTSEDNEESIPSMLDLAQAYLEMDDKEEASQILKKVIEKGDETQKAEAEALLKRCEL